MFWLFLNDETKQIKSGLLSGIMDGLDLKFKKDTRRLKELVTESGYVSTRYTNDSNNFVESMEEYSNEYEFLFKGI